MTMYKKSSSTKIYIYICRESESAFEFDMYSSPANTKETGKIAVTDYVKIYLKQGGSKSHCHCLLARCADG